MKVRIGLGTNLGDRVANLVAACRLLRERGCLSNLSSSAIFESEAMLLPGAPADWNLPFLNVVVQGETQFAPHSLLREIQKVEIELGRGPHNVWSPRTIDIDILSFGQEVIDTNDLRIPHPAIYERPFVLLPLAMVAPNWRNPLNISQTTRARAQKWQTGYEVGKVENIPYRTALGSFEINSHYSRDLDRLEIPVVKHATAPSELVGILNLTPDSFSDGGKFLELEKAADAIRQMVMAGASVIDIGAESTRPGATRLSLSQEWQRLEPVLRNLAELLIDLPERPLISLDTCNVETIERALQFEIDWINDVTALSDSRMCELVSKTNLNVVMMHNLGVPPSSQHTIPTVSDPIEVIVNWAEGQVRRLSEYGIGRERIIIDPGIGFGKTPAQAIQIIKQARRLQALQLPVLVGHSRKSFISSFAKLEPQDRDFESALISHLLISQGIQYVRVHNVGLTSRAARVSQVFSAL